jgi:hypothetical protein
MKKATAYKITGAFCGAVITLSLFLHPESAGTAVAAAFALIGTVLAGLVGILPL